MPVAHAGGLRQLAGGVEPLLHGGLAVPVQGDDGQDIAQGQTDGRVDDAHEGGRRGSARAAERAAQHVLHGHEHIEEAEEPQSPHAHFQRLLIHLEGSHEVFPEEVEDEAQDDGEAHRHDAGGTDAVVGALHVSGANVLADVGGDGCLEAHHGHHGEAVHLHDDAVGGDVVGAEAVGKALGHQHAGGEGRVLNGGGQPQPDDQSGNALVRLQVAEVDLRPVGALALPPQEEQAGGEVGNDGRPGDARHVPVELRHEEQIQNDVQKSRDDQSVHGGLGVPQAADQTVHAVVDDVAAGADEDDAEIGGASVHDILRGTQEPEQRPGKNKAQGRDDDAHQHTEGEGGGHRLFQILVVLCALILGNDDVRAHAHPHEEGAEEHHDREAGIHGGDALRAVGSEVSHDQRVHHVVELLEEVAQDGGYGEKQDLLRDVSCRQVMIDLRSEGSFFFGHRITAFLSDDWFIYLKT